MTRGLHERAVEIFSEAIEIPDDAARLERVESACAGDLELRRHVLDMLDADRGGGLSTPALELAAGLMAEQVSLASEVRNSSLGAYLVGEPIGAGGMGTVYEAHDTRLDRKVALKVLPSLFGSDPDRVRRFRQEARAASLLNHPNIVSIYDAEFDRGRCYIATEFIEGRTLRQMLPIELPRLAEIGIQICAALDAAHRAGIVHRDIKPENVMVRNDGIVKVLDFGLAKVTEAAPAVPLLETATGVLTGTGPYVSPEQLMGRPATPQSDLFAVGVVLYEAATGARPFTGPTQVAVGSAILHDRPAAPSSLSGARSGLGGPEMSAEFDAIVLRLLEKDPELRYQTAADLRAALRILVRGSGPSPTMAPTAALFTDAASPLGIEPARRRAWLRTAVAGVTGAVLAAAATWLSLRFTSAAPKPEQFERVTESTTEAIYANLTVDGKQVVYSSADEGKWNIYLQRVGGRASSNLTGDSGVDDSEPALSRDGSRIAFRSERDGGGIFVMESTGENPVKVAGSGYLPAWSPDGKSIVWSEGSFIVPSIRGAPSRLHITDLASGRRRDLKTDDAIQPNWSPHGYRIAYWGFNTNSERDIMTIAADGTGEPVHATNDAAVDWNPVWSPDGRYLYFISDRGGSMNLWRVRIDERSGRTEGDPEAVILPAGSIRSLSFSADGSRLAYSTSQGRLELYSVGFDAAKLEAVGQPMRAPGRTHVVGSFSISPDGASVVYDTVGDVTEDIWIENLDGSGRRRVTSDTFRNRTPEWTPSGNEILFFSNRSGVFNDWLIRPDGSGLRQLTAFQGSGGQSGVWSADGRMLLVVRHTGGLVQVDAHATKPPAEAPILEGTRMDGILIHGEARNHVYLGHATPNATEEIVRVVWPPGRLEPTGIRGRSPWWLPGSDHEFVFIRENTIYFYDLVARREKVLLSVAPNRPYILRVAPDGRRLWFSQQIREGNVWIGRMDTGR